MRDVNGVILSLCVLEWGLGRGVMSVVSVVSVSVVRGESRPGGSSVVQRFEVLIKK